MITLTIFTLLISVPLISYTINPVAHTRVTAFAFVVAAIISVYSVDLHDDTTYSLFNDTFIVSNLVLYMDGLLYLSCAMILSGWCGRGRNKLTIPEYPLLVLFSAIGASMIMSANDLVSLVLSLEIQSFSLYVIATMYRNSQSATSAGLKYFLLGGFSSAIIILGTGLVYMDCGTTNFQDLFMLNSGVNMTSTFLLGMTLIGLGILFKVAAAPLHYWAPDVYDGIPTIITTWLMVVPKISLFVVLYNLTSGMGPLWSTFLLISAVLSLIIGTVLGLVQTKLKRLLTYSTISHVGFMLLALSMNTLEGDTAFIFYLTQYSLSNITLFLLVLIIGYISKKGKEIASIAELDGLNKINPMLALCLSLTLLSMAGIPPMIGFFAKMQVLYATISTGSYYVSVIAVVTSVISTYYYLQIITSMYFKAPGSSMTMTPSREIYRMRYVSRLHGCAIVLGMVPVIGFLAYPNLLLNISSLLALANYTG